MSLNEKVSYVCVRRFQDYTDGYYNTWEFNAAHPVPQDPSSQDWYWATRGSKSPAHTEPRKLPRF